MKGAQHRSALPRSLCASAVLCCAALVVAAWVLGAESRDIPAPWNPSIQVRGPVTDANGFTEYQTLSDYQPGWLPVRVILPSQIEPGRRYPILYLLPVETDATEREKWGSALAEARKLDVANKYGFICVAPVFAQIPWYADHPTDPLIRQESYFLKVIAPLAEHYLPTRKDPAGRLLVGFSKSGNGAFSLLLRYPEQFGCAAAWDAPLVQLTPERYGMDKVYATQANYENYSFLPLLAQRAEELRRSRARRLTLLGYDIFPDQISQADAELDRLGVPHFFDNDTRRKHAWDSGWFPEAVQDLATCSSELGER
jgi:S-formylglutathione hydrolase FrmB